jgi:DNA-directed RNA polymerase subunit RPC12/RpoP
MEARKWPRKGPQDRKHIGEGTLVWDGRVKMIKMARRCSNCKKLYLVPWDRLNSKREVRCMTCKNSDKEGLQGGK